MDYDSEFPHRIGSRYLKPGVLFDMALLMTVLVILVPPDVNDKHGTTKLPGVDM